MTRENVIVCLAAAVGGFVCTLLAVYGRQQ